MEIVSRAATSKNHFYLLSGNKTVKGTGKPVSKNPVEFASGASSLEGVGVSAGEEFQMFLLPNFPAPLTTLFQVGQEWFVAAVAKVGTFC